MRYIIPIVMLALGFTAGRMLHQLERQLRIDVPKESARKGIMFLFRVLTILLLMAVSILIAHI